jgi:hypothetical protein
VLTARLLAIAVAAFALVMAAAPARADERPPTDHLVWAGLGFALPTYFVGVAAHEGSHALAAELAGAEVTELHLLPGVRHGHFYFGYVRTRGLASAGQRAFFLVAPKLVDLAVLGSYSAAVLTDTTPDNHYGRLALAVLATGFWVDFSKDIPAFWPHSDVVKLYDLAGATSELGRLPLRLVHLGLSAAAGAVLWIGYRDVFDDDADPAGDPALLLPLAVGSF